MNFGEKASLLGDFRNLLQGFLAPELGELKAKLRALSDGQKIIIDGQHEIEARILREIRSSEEKLSMKIQLAEAAMRLEQANVKIGETSRIAEEALRENEQLKREKTQ